MSLTKKQLTVYPQCPREFHMASYTFEYRQFNACSDLWTNWREYRDYPTAEERDRAMSTFKQQHYRTEVRPVDK